LGNVRRLTKVTCNDRAEVLVGAGQGAAAVGQVCPVADHFDVRTHGVGVACSVRDPAATGDAQQPRDAFPTHPHPEPEPELGVHPRLPEGAAGVAVDVHDRVR